MRELNHTELKQVSGGFSFSLFGGTVYICENGWLIGWERAI